MNKLKQMNCPLNKNRKYLFFVLTEFINFSQYSWIFSNFFYIFEITVFEEFKITRKNFVLVEFMNCSEIEDTCKVWKIFYGFEYNNSTFSNIITKLLHYFRTFPTFTELVR